MSITTIILAGALSILPRAPVQLTVDFDQVTTGIDYKIEIKLIDLNGQQIGKTQAPIVGAAADVDDIIFLFQTVIDNRGLTAKPIAGTKKVEIVGARGNFGRIEYSTFSKQGDNWIPNSKIKGPTCVGRVGETSPNLVVNPKPL